MNLVPCEWKASPTDEQVPKMAAAIQVKVSESTTDLLNSNVLRQIMDQMTLTAFNFPVYHKVI